MTNFLPSLNCVRMKSSRQQLFRTEKRFQEEASLRQSEITSGCELFAKAESNRSIVFRRNLTEFLGIQYLGKLGCAFLITQVLNLVRNENEPDAQNYTYIIKAKLTIETLGVRFDRERERENARVKSSVFIL